MDLGWEFLALTEMQSISTCQDFFSFNSFQYRPLLYLLKSNLSNYYKHLVIVVLSSKCLFKIFCWAGEMAQLLKERLSNNFFFFFFVEQRVLSSLGCSGTPYIAVLRFLCHLIKNVRFYLGYSTARNSSIFSIFQAYDPWT